MCSDPQNLIWKILEQFLKNLFCSAALTKEIVHISKYFLNFLSVILINKCILKCLDLPSNSQLLKIIVELRGYSIKSLYFLRCFLPVGTSGILPTVILETVSHSITAMTTHPGE